MIKGLDCSDAAALLPIYYIASLALFGMKMQHVSRLIPSVPLNKNVLAEVKSHRLKTSVSTQKGHRPSLLAQWPPTNRNTEYPVCPVELRNSPAKKRIKSCKVRRWAPGHFRSHPPAKLPSRRPCHAKLPPSPRTCAACSSNVARNVAHYSACKEDRAHTACWIVQHKHKEVNCLYLVSAPKMLRCALVCQNPPAVLLP